MATVERCVGARLIPWLPRFQSRAFGVDFLLDVFVASALWLFQLTEPIICVSRLKCHDARCNKQSCDVKLMKGIKQVWDGMRVDKEARSVGEVCRV